MQPHLVHLILRFDRGRQDYLRVATQRSSGGCEALDRRVDGCAVLDGHSATTRPQVVNVARRTLSHADLGSSAADRSAECSVRAGYRARAGAEPHEICRASLEMPGLSVQLHTLDVPAEERWRRVEGRNAKIKGKPTSSGSMSRVRCSILSKVRGAADRVGNEVLVSI
jgi:hypothetical protein